jgi:hypothetical protein
VSDHTDISFEAPKGPAFLHLAAGTIFETGRYGTCMKAVNASGFTHGVLLGTGLLVCGSQFTDLPIRVFPKVKVVCG